MHALYATGSRTAGFRERLAVAMLWSGSAVQQESQDDQPREADNRSCDWPSDRLRPQWALPDSGKGPPARPLNSAGEGHDGGRCEVFWHGQHRPGYDAAEVTARSF